MPGPDTSHLPQTFVSLPRKLLCVPAACHTSMSLGDSNNVDHLILAEDSRDGDRLLQTLLCPVHLVRDAPPIQLHLHDVAVFLHRGKILVQLLLSCLILPLLTVLGEGLLLATPHTPVSIKSSLALVTEVLGKDGFKITQVEVDPFIHTEADAMHLPQRVRHAGLVSHEGSEVDGLAGVIFGPGAHLASVLLAPLVGQEPHVPVAGCVEFAVRLE
uniref:Uncharacterized protein n=1 Tax=Labrus bergylta TaxID=56723 RepID=A0A3Q3GNE0_9LABR